MGEEAGSEGAVEGEVVAAGGGEGLASICEGGGWAVAARKDGELAVGDGEALSCPGAAVAGLLLLLLPLLLLLLWAAWASS